MVTDENIDPELQLPQDPVASGTGSEPVCSRNVAPEKHVRVVKNIVQLCLLIPDKTSVLRKEYEEQLYVPLKLSFSTKDADAESIDV